MALLRHIEFVRTDKASSEPVPVRTITDVSISPETARDRALALLPEMQWWGATTFVIRNVGRAGVNGGRSETRITGKAIHETGGRVRAFALLGGRRTPAPVTD
jgi:hypothetical protein